MANYRYSIGYVACVRNSAARDYLSSVGLPVEHVLFSAAEDAGGGVESAGGRSLLELGFGGDGDDAYCIDCETGEVFYRGSGDPSLYFVNSSPQKLSEFLSVFEFEVARSTVEDDLETLEELADLLGRSFGEIDPSALRDDPGFWRSILFDVAIGDYVDDEL
ncbi:SUKH-4 family immunity protein [Streptomyces sp. LS1784]|uniref:SUKH-4 family immunity protein n=1 Tax=Streptomyces sp. LS1784 TaxID=2851533 RepID=UPI001CC99925|nr:SUKH-4 family immunity protein [Streptomyces sp. LS1784]